MLNVKNKDAGRKGLCPTCEGEVVIAIHDPSSGGATREAFSGSLLGDESGSSSTSKSLGGRYAASLDRAEERHAEPDDQDVIDADTAYRATTGSERMSFVGSLAVRRQRQCSCGALAPVWYAKRKSCGAELNAQR